MRWSISRTRLRMIGVRFCLSLAGFIAVLELIVWLADAYLFHASTIVDLELTALAAVACQSLVSITAGLEPIVSLASACPSVDAGTVITLAVASEADVWYRGSLLMPDDFMLLIVSIVVRLWCIVRYLQTIALLGCQLFFARFIRHFK